MTVSTTAAFTPAPGARVALLDAAVTGPLRQAPGRTLLAVLAIALGLALGFSVYLVNRVAADEVQLASRSLFGMADLSVRAPGRGLDERLFPVLAGLPGIAHASPVVEVQARLPGRDRALKLVGIDPFRASRLQPALSAPVATAASGPGLLADDAVWLSPSAARAFGLGIGDELEVQVALEVVRLRVSALLPAGDYRQPLGMLDIATAQWRLDRLGRLDCIDLKLEPGAETATVRAAVEAVLPPGVQVTTPGQAGDDAVRLSRAYRSNLTALALVALFTGAFLVYATQSLSVARRRREIALLHAIGMTVREQLGAALLSGMLVGAVGAALGILLGIFVAQLGLANFGADLGAGYFRGIAPRLDLRLAEIGAFFALGVAVAVMAAAGPAREAAMVPAAAALKSGDEAAVAARRHGFIAILFGIGSIAALMLPPLEGIAVPGYAAIACLLLGAVFMTPTIAHLAFGRLPDGGAAWLQLACAQLRGTARRSTVSIAAVLVSFSLMVAMAIMVYSFRLSLDAWMQRILPADLYVRAGPAGQTGFLDEAGQAAIRAVAGLARVEFLRHQEVVLPGDSLAVAVIARSVDEDSAATILPLRRVDPEPLPPGAVPVWVSEAMYDLRGIDAGSVFELPLGGRTATVSVRGLWRDYERPGGAIVLPREVFVSYTGDTRASSAGLWLADGVDTAATAARIRAALGESGTYEIAEPREIRRRSLGVFDRTFAITYLLEAIAVLIGLFGISASASAQVLARRSEFGMLRHLGVTRGEIGRMLAFEGAALAAVGVVTGLVVGGIVSLILVYVVNRQSFHWTMDVHVPWLLLAALSTTLVVAAAVTAVVSGRQAMTDDVVRAVREDW